jgi:hypothetical protein
VRLAAPIATEGPIRSVLSPTGLRQDPSCGGTRILVFMRELI